MDESSLQIFIESTTHYFSQVSNIPASMDTPYLVDNTQCTAYDYTGIIGISGSYKGQVSFTAPNVLLKYLLIKMGINDVSDENLADLVGEVANTISGNVRKKLGNKFMISVPSVINAGTESITLPENHRSYVIPIKWHNYRANLLVSPDTTQ